MLSESERTTLQNILAVACEEFLQKGFQGASLRNIVRRANVTTGAFYGYFKSKEELFDALVKNQYTHILEMYRTTLDNFHRMLPDEQRSCMAEYTIAEMSHMTDYIYDHFEAFKLILCCSEGTLYENLIHDMSQMDCDATRDFSNTMNQNGMEMNVVHPQLEHMLTSGMFYAFFEMVVHDIPKESTAEYIRQLVHFYEAGWQRIMGF